MQRLIPRSRLLAAIQRSLGESPATVLLGARQVGKTTLARLVAQRWKAATMYDLERAAPCTRE